MARIVLVTGANGYIGNAVARAFARGGWTTYGLVRSSAAAETLANNEKEQIRPIIGSIDDKSSFSGILQSLPPVLDTIVSTTEDVRNYVTHHHNTVSLLLTLSHSTVKNGGTKPLVIFTSGCKDYGQGLHHFENDPELTPHTEESSLNPPPIIATRTKYTQRIFDHKDHFQPVLVRPTNVYGHSSSYYRAFFTIATKAAQDNKPLRIGTATPPSTILHALHVDDCGDAYVAIANHDKQGQVAGRVFNISAGRYETLGQILDALVAEYGIAPGWKIEEGGEVGWPVYMIDFPQWTSSTALRRLTGWDDARPLFSKDIARYRAEARAAETAFGGIKAGEIDSIQQYLASSKSE